VYGSHGRVVEYENGNDSEVYGHEVEWDESESEYEYEYGVSVCVEGVVEPVEIAAVSAGPSHHATSTHNVTM